MNLPTVREWARRSQPRGVSKLSHGLHWLREAGRKEAAVGPERDKFRPKAAVVLGRRINNFEIVRLIGEGGMGAVYEAVHPLIHRKVAVKVLRREFTFDEDLVRRFFNEARATNEIRHPNIVEIIDVGVLPDSVPYLILEMLEGESLGTRLARVGSLDVAAAVDIAWQASSALEAAHDRGIVHRDLKPDNIFLCPDPRAPGHELVKVLDFGIAKLRAGLSSSPVDTRAGAILGTPPYMSPEQCRGVPEEVDQRTDVYGLGIILYEMLCGQPPFVAPGVGDVMMMHMSVLPEPPSKRRSDVPEQVERAVLMALAKRREERFSSMAEFRSALGSGGEFVSVAVRSQSSSYPGNRSLESAPTALFENRRAGDGVTTPPQSRQSVASAPEATSLNHTKDSERTPHASVQPVARSQRKVWLVGGVAVVGAIAALLVLNSGRKPDLPQPSVKSAPASVSVVAALPERPPPPGSQLTAAGSDLPNHVPEARATRKVQRSLQAPTVPVSSGLAPTANSSVTAAAAPLPEPQLNPPVAASAAAAQVGYLTLDSAPWSNVFLGAKLLGTTPLFRVALPPGRHILTLKNSELGASTSYVVEIKSGTAISRFVGWEKP